MNLPKHKIMSNQQLYFFALLLFIVSCKPVQPIVINTDDKNPVDDGTGKVDTIKKTAGVDTEIANFRISYDMDNAYEEFGAPKIIKNVDNTSNRPKDRVISSKLHINDTLENKLSQIRYLNGDVDKIIGYRILIYSGNNLDQARSYHSDLQVALSGTGNRSNLEYEPPNYIVKAGKFVSKLKAHQLFTELKKDFPRAIVIEELIDFKRSKYEID